MVYPMSDLCLVPISVGNELFRTDVFLPAMRLLVERHSRFEILVADQIQLYNKATRVGSPRDLAAVLSQFRIKSNYLEERWHWADRVFTKLEAEAGRPLCWRVRGIQDLIDGEFYQICKAVVIMYHTIDAFRYDVNVAAARHVERRSERKSTTPTVTTPLLWNASEHQERRKTAIYLGVCYLLEEIAVNLRVRIGEGIFHEYYLGETLTPLVKLYEGAYDVNVEELAGKNRPAKPFRFYEYSSTAGGPKWNLVSRSEL